MIDKKYELVVGQPDTEELPSLYLWLEVSGYTVVLKSKRDNAPEVTEMRFFPNGDLIANHITDPECMADKSNFQLVK